MNTFLLKKIEIPIFRQCAKLSLAFLLLTSFHQAWAANKKKPTKTESGNAIMGKDGEEVKSGTALRETPTWEAGPVQKGILDPNGPKFSELPRESQAALLDPNSPWAKIPVWGEFIPPILSALGNLKNIIMGTEFEDYLDFEARMNTVAKVLLSKDPAEKVEPLSDSANGYLIVAAKSFLRLQKTQGYREDLNSNLVDKRHKVVAQLERQMNRLMEHLVTTGHAEKTASGYEVKLGQSIVGNFSELLLHPETGVVTTLIKAAGEYQHFSAGLGSKAPEFAKILKANLEWMAADVAWVSAFKGGDGSSCVDDGTVKLIHWFDLWSTANGGKDDLFKASLYSFKKAGEANPERRQFYVELGTKMDQLVAVIEAIKATVQYGIPHNGMNEFNLKERIKEYEAVARCSPNQIKQ